MCWPSGSGLRSTRWGSERADAALDVGCGTGDEVRLLAERVGRSGRSVGVDLSEKPLAIARERTPPALGAEFVAADAHALPFGDGEFAAARVERTLLHVAAPARVMQEVARVVRIGGRVVALETDWDTLVISSDDAETTREILDAQRAGIRHPSVGRTLARYFVDAGIVPDRVDALAVAICDATAARGCSCSTARSSGSGRKRHAAGSLKSTSKPHAEPSAPPLTAFVVAGTVRD